jgi:hypothetical protein
MARPPVAHHVNWDNLSDTMKIDFMHQDIVQLHEQVKTLQERVKTIDLLRQEISSLRTAVQPLLDAFQVQADGSVEVRTNLSVTNGADIVLE